MVISFPHLVKRIYNVIAFIVFFAIDDRDKETTGILSAKKTQILRILLPTTINIDNSYG